MKSEAQAIIQMNQRVRKGDIGVGIIRERLAMTACCCMLAGAIMGCGNESQQYVARGATDARLIDPAITDSDPLLAIGDMNVESVLHADQIGDSRVGSSYTAYRQNDEQVYPNPSIPPYEGGYTENVIAMASLFMGWPYEYGSDRSDPSTFDCSDFTRWSYLSALGMDIPTNSRSQAQYIQTYSNRVYRDITEAKRGDLLFFISYRGGSPDNYEHADKSLPQISHVGISLGDGRMIHTASAATGGVRIDPVTENHLQYRFVIGGSVLDAR
jgi:peptidoglycan DL-endopeptidase CwlO